MPGTSTFQSTVDPIFGSAIRSTPTIGGDEEMVQRAAIVQIFKNLNEAVQYEEGIWAARDMAFAEEMERKFTPVNIELPKSDSFYTGPRPSLVESPSNYWPSITARCNGGRSASPADQLDTIDVVVVDLFIEVLCKAGPVNQEELHQRAGIEADGSVDAQVQRLTAAVQGCIARDKTLGGVVQWIDRPPTVKPSIPFARPGTGPKGSGPYFVFQGKQLLYTIVKQAL
jgi:hypothetical protein